MYEGVFDLLKRKKINDDSDVDVIMDWPISKALAFAEKIFYLIEEDSHATRIDSNITNYSFLANSNMSGHSDGGCIQWNCRISRVEKLARFTILYSDSLYLPNYFETYQHVQSNIQDEYDKSSLRYNVAGDVKILLYLKPLLLSGVSRFLPTMVILCPSCSAKLSENISKIDTRLTQEIKLLESSFAETTSAKLETLKSPQYPLHQGYKIEVNCDDELFDHGSYIEIGTRLPRILQRKLDNKPSQHEFILTKSEILRSHLNRHLLQNIATDISRLKFYQEGLSLKYLTDRHIDISLLSAINDNQEFREYNEIFTNYLAFQLPIFQNVPLDILLNIRQNEKETFFSYRKALNSILKQHVFQNKPISSRDAQQIYSDVIYPEVKQLNNKVSSIRKSSLTKSLKPLVVSIGALTFGLFSSSISPAFLSALYGLGLMAAYDSAKYISTIIQPDKKIRNENFYFLWKVYKKSK